ncbi:MAG: hypothetical protein LC660_15100 [Desulfobacteraceae bacterium]|nr:hypothetical protein [Desulfobacteraceae bacterium]
MAKNIRRKRPCSICRKWFQPIPQQINRQKTCSPACQNELHRRQCEEWNRKNKAYFKNNYLTDKLDAIDQQEQSKDPPADQPALPKNPSVFFLPQSHQTDPIVPMDVIVAHLGRKHAVIIQYLVFQITRHVRSGPSGYE